jgi:hypothetical protein
MVPLWYHDGVAMNLRTTREDDEALERLAALYGVSKQQAVLRAVHETLGREAHRARVTDSSQRMRAQWSQTLEDLAKA